MLQFSDLGKDCNIFHFVTTRHGGIGVGNYESFNLGEYVEDNPDTVYSNREILCGNIGIKSLNLFVPYQTHETKIALLDKAFIRLTSEEKKKALFGVDALVASCSGICIAVTTADCVPLLICDKDGSFVSAIHAGWRGTSNNIAGKTVDYLRKQFNCDPGSLSVGIGPSISMDAFEVGHEVVEAFRSIILSNPSVHYIKPETGKSHLDLWEINRLQLIQAGVNPKQIEVSGLCTYTNHQDFFSARRAGIRSGRILSGIMIKEI